MFSLMFYLNFRFQVRSNLKRVRVFTFVNNNVQFGLFLRDNVFDRFSLSANTFLVTIIELAKFSR